MRVHIRMNFNFILKNGPLFEKWGTFPGGGRKPPGEFRGRSFPESPGCFGGLSGAQAAGKPQKRRLLLCFYAFFVHKSTSFEGDSVPS